MHLPCMPKDKNFHRLYTSCHQSHLTETSSLFPALEVYARPASNASSRALASLKSAVSKPSLNQPYTGASSSRASLYLPCCCHRRARLVAARSSQDFACCCRAHRRRLDARRAGAGRHQHHPAIHTDPHTHTALRRPPRQGNPPEGRHHRQPTATA